MSLFLSWFFLTTYLTQYCSLSCSKHRSVPKPVFSHASLFPPCCSHIWASRLHPFSAACIEKSIQILPPFIILAVPAVQCSWLNTRACLLQLLLDLAPFFPALENILHFLLISGGAALLALKFCKEPHAYSGAVQAFLVSCYKPLSHCPHLIFISIFIFSHFSLSFY